MIGKIIAKHSAKVAQTVTKPKKAKIRNLNNHIFCSATKKLGNNYQIFFLSSQNSHQAKKAKIPTSKKDFQQGDQKVAEKVPNFLKRSQNSHQDKKAKIAL
jgi:hypothetical protein